MRKTQIWPILRRYWGCAICSVCVHHAICGPEHPGVEVTRWQFWTTPDVTQMLFWLVAVKMKIQKAWTHTLPFLSKLILLTDPSLSGTYAFGNLKKKICSKITFRFEKSFEKKNMDFYLNNVPLSISSSWGNSDFITIQLNHSWGKYEWNQIIYSGNNIMTLIWQVLCCWPSNSAGPTPTMMIDIGRQEA